MLHLQLEPNDENVVKEGATATEIQIKQLGLYVSDCQGLLSPGEWDAIINCVQKLL